MQTLQFAVVDSRGPFLFWRDGAGKAFTRTTAEEFAAWHNDVLSRTPGANGDRLSVCELLPAGHRQRVCELSVELDEQGLDVWAPRLHDLAHE